MNNTPYIQAALIIIMIAASATSVDAQTLTLDEVVRAATRHSPSLRAASIEAQRARLGVDVQEGTFTPQLGAEVGVQKQISGDGQDAVVGSVEVSKTFTTGTELRGIIEGSRSIFTDTGSFAGRDDLDPAYRLSARVELVQPWLRGFGEHVGDAGVIIARHQADAAALKQQAEASQLLKEVLTAYWELWYAQAALASRVHALEVAREELADGERRVAAGALGAGALLPLRTEIASLEESRMEAAATVKRWAIVLSRHMGEGNPATLQVATDAPSARSVEAVETLLGDVEERSFTLRQIEADMEAQRVNLLVAEDNGQLRLDSVVWLEAAGLDSSTAGAAEQFGTFDDVSGFVGLRLQAPLDSASTRAATSQARLAVSASSERYQAELERIRQEVAQQLTGLESAYARLDLAEQTAGLAEESVQLKREEFKAGATTSLDVVRVLQQAREADLRVARIHADIALGHLALDDMTGKLVDDLPGN